MQVLWFKGHIDALHAAYGLTPLQEEGNRRVDELRDQAVDMHGHDLVRAANAALARHESHAKLVSRCQAVLLAAVTKAVLDNTWDDKQANATRNNVPRGLRTAAMQPKGQWGPPSQGPHGSQTSNMQQQRTGGRRRFST